MYINMSASHSMHFTFQVFHVLWAFYFAKMQYCEDKNFGGSIFCGLLLILKRKVCYNTDRKEGKGTTTIVWLKEETQAGYTLSRN